MPEGPISNIHERPPLVLENLEELSVGQMEILRRRITESDGTIMMYVHPYYPEEGSVWSDVSGDELYSRADIQKSFERIVAIQDVDKPPLVLLEQASEVPALNNHLAARPNVPIYLVETDKNDEDTYSGGAGVGEARWLALIDKLNGLGVRRVVLSGTNLVISIPDDENAYIGPAGCIGAAAKFLSERFSVQISKFVHPNSKEDYKQWNGPTGPEYKKSKE